MKIKTLNNQKLSSAYILCIVLFFANMSISYSQFVEKKADTTKKDTVKTSPAKPVKPIIKTVIKEVSEADYDIPQWSFGVQLVPRFGNTTLIEVAPFAAKKISSKLLGGLGVVYAFSQTDNGTTTTSRSHYGARLFAQYYPTKYLFGHAELGAMSIESGGTTTDPTTGQTVTVSNRNTGTDLIVGGGFRFPVGKKLALQVMVLHDMIRQNNTSLHGLTSIRLGVTF
ncbi:hypothetical protein [Microscilla marina]|uniref:Outer membrane protein beta-barrel domain-containing protein n=1 Tax=Microscilla marina ATCC 23134 TaxID=313606 RepID=A1ZW27_MICM2|nr:hypothetical protein [Microscilla marina]EAY25390.1 hypothetical protein M23134_06649 [Microscilla marina ATCC 23134]